MVSWKPRVKNVSGGSGLLCDDVKKSRTIKKDKFPIDLAGRLLAPLKSVASWSGFDLFRAQSK